MIEKVASTFLKYTSGRVPMKSNGNHKAKYLTAKGGKALLDRQARRC